MKRATRQCAQFLIILCTLGAAAYSAPAPSPPPPAPPPPLSSSDVVSRVLETASSARPFNLTSTAFGDQNAAETPTPDLFTGAASNRIVIPVPTGRVGMQPAISIVYSSTNQDPGIFGYGWSLSLGSIQRVSSRNSDKRVEYQYAGPMGILDLIPIGGNVYRPKIESGYSLFEKIDDANGEYWEALDKSGNTSLFGVTAAARLLMPDGSETALWNISQVLDRNSNYTTFSYLCDGGSSTPQRGCTGSALIPEAISYTGNEASHILPTHCVLFRTETRPEHTPVTRAGFYFGTLTYRIHAIDTYPLGGATCTIAALAGKTTETRFLFGYDQGAISGRSRLVSFGAKGLSGNPAPLTRTFTYYAGESGYSTGDSPTKVLSRLDSTGVANQFGQLHTYQRAFVDSRGNGVPSFCYFNGIKTFSCLGNSSFGKYLSPSSNRPLPTDIGSGPDGRDASVIGLYYPTLNTAGRTDVCALLFLSDETKELNCWIRNAEGFSARVVTPIRWPKKTHYSQQSVDHEVRTLLSSVRFLDLNGDGVSDICWRTEDIGLRCVITIPAAIGTDAVTTHFDKWADVPPEFRTGQFGVPPFNPFIIGPPYQIPDPDPDRYFKSIRFVDLNNDGYQDICARTPDGLRCYIYGSGTWTQVVLGPRWGNPAAPPLPAPQPIPPPGIVPPPAPVLVGNADWTREEHYASIQFADIDGDGFPDVCARDNDGVVCYLGLGDHFSTVPIRGPAWAGPAWDANTRYFRSVSLVDLNGDGLSDICANNPATGLECFLGSVNGFSATPSFTVALPQSDPDIGDAFNGLMFTDINGDGKADICLFQKDGLGCFESTVGDRADLLHSSQLTTGQTWTLEYTPSTRYNNVRLPFPLPLLSRLTESTTVFDASTDESATPHTHKARSVTDFEYDGGFYNPVNREFLGFAHARSTEQSRTDELGERLHHDYTYFQHDVRKELPDTGVSGTSYLKGRIREESVSDSSGRIYSRVTYRYERETQIPVIPRLAEIQSFQCSTTRGCVDPTIIQMSYDEFSNKVIERHFGDGPRANDDVRIEIHYLGSSVPELASLPREIATFSGVNGGRRLSTTLLFYDEPLQCPGVASTSQTPQDPRAITRGLLTRVVRVGTLGEAAQVTHAYDRYGNESCVGDANGHAIKIQFDEDVATFPIRKVDPVGHVSRITYSGLGRNLPILPCSAKLVGD